MDRKTLKKQVNYALFIATFLMILTGLGITEPGIITMITFGFLDKLVSYRLHFILWGPFTILFILHIALNVIPRKWFL